MLPPEMQESLETLSLKELMPHWCNQLWWTGMRPVFQRMLKVDLTLSENIVLRSLQRSPLTVAEVADCLYITHSAASRAVDRLVHDGFVSRQEHPVDRRQKLLTLTPEGAALIREFESIAANGMERLVSALNEEEREQFRSLLARMIVAQIPGIAPRPGKHDTPDTGPACSLTGETLGDGVEAARRDGQALRLGDEDDRAVAVTQR